MIRSTTMCTEDILQTILDKGNIWKRIKDKLGFNDHADKNYRKS